MIQYPVARGQDGAPIHIDDWERSQTVTCFGCGQDLVGRLPHDGIKPTAHFAHKGDTACCGETALHKAAKAAIIRAHVNGYLQTLVWECPRCNRCRQQTDLRSLVLHGETRPSINVQSDVLGENEFGEPCVAIEVVVTHDMKPKTVERYRALGFYVFSLQASWGIIGEISRGLDPLPVDYRLGIVDTASCEGCQQILREKEEWAARERVQKAKAWWGALVTAWFDVWKEELRRFDDQRRVLLAQRAREQSWWQVWKFTWQRIQAERVVSWGIEWRQVWRDLGVECSRPYIWQRRWQEVWEAVSKQYVADEVERARDLAKEEAAQAWRLVEEKRNETLRRYTWWPEWTRVWAEIGDRESGAMAAWRPICKRCRRDVKQDQLCPCDDV